MITRRISKTIHVGRVAVGGGATISVQSMTKTDTRDVAATVYQIKELEEAGCEIVRVAVPDKEAAAALLEIKKRISIPVIADIHFDYRLALAALETGVDGLRLNPGNINERSKVASVVMAAKERSVPIRIGVNAGSLPPAADPSQDIAERMVSAAMGHVKILEDLDFDQIKVSLKAFDVPTTIAAYQQIASLVPYPLHLGITESGPNRTGVIRSAVGIGTLLYLGLGDTIRVSLSASPVEEVVAGFEILKSLGLRQKGPVLVSCPQCGRAEVDIIDLARQMDNELRKINRTVKVAVMGCVVNGPGEARDADVGIACGREAGILFKKGQKIGVVERADFVTAVMREIKNLEQ
jgi:(E)-4-hydroxy-3-methylbut-2-enyl-diphosphate synthase